MVSFAMQKLLNLIRSHLFIFIFISITCRRQVIEDLAVIYVKEVLPMFSSKIFIFSGLIYRSLIHFEFIFMYGVRKCFNFFLLHVEVQFSQNNLLKRLSFLHYVFLHLLSKIRCPQGHGFFSGLSILFHWSIFLLCVSTILS